jgi:monoamine oxidase
MIHFVVIGAGLAGLTAAYRIEKLTGEAVSIYEVRSRAGGRVDTLYLEDGSFEELGGKFLTDGANPIYITELIRELGLKTTSYPIDLQGRFVIAGEKESI